MTPQLTAQDHTHWGGQITAGARDFFSDMLPLASSSALATSRPTGVDVGGCVVGSTRASGATVPPLLAPLLALLPPLPAALSTPLLPTANTCSVKL
jgi:hypothetical protein